MPHEQVFQGSICGYDVKIILNSDGIIIFLWNPHRRRCYQAKLQYEYSGKSKEIQDIFTNLDQFYVYITQFSEDRERVNINQSGRIQVFYHLNKSKNKSPPVIYIDTEILLAGYQIKNEKKLQTAVGDVKRENLRMQMKINHLQKLNQENKKLIQDIKIMIQKKQFRHDEPSSSESEEQKVKHKERKKKKKKYSVISGGKSGIVELNETVKEVAAQLFQIKQQIIKETPKVKKPVQVMQIYQNKEPISEAALFGQRMIITVDRNNRFLEKQYKIQGNLITKIKGYGRYQVLSKQVIPPTGRHHFIMFIQHISFKLFSLGIVNQKRRNFQNSHLSPDLISYFSKTGAIWQNGDCRGGGPQIPNGVEITIVVDMNKYTVTWYMDKRQIATTVIREHLRKERLVAYLQFNYEKDKVYWNEKEEFTNK